MFWFVQYISIVYLFIIIIIFFLVNIAFWQMEKQ